MESFKKTLDIISANHQVPSEVRRNRANIVSKFGLNHVGIAAKHFLEILDCCALGLCTLRPGLDSMERQQTDQVDNMYMHSV